MHIQALVIAALVGFDLPFLAVATAHHAFKRSKSCTTNACLAVVEKGAKRGGIGDCHNFQTTTVIPSTITTTVKGTTTRTHYTTSTSTSTVPSTMTTTTATPTSYIPPTPYSPPSSTPAQELRARTNEVTTKFETQMPHYASKACQDTQNYASACSCIGATKSTVTSIATVTKRSFTTTSTSTVISIAFQGQTATSTETTTTATATGCAQPQPTFYLQGAGPGIDGYRAYLGAESWGYYLYFGAPADNATPGVAFSRDANCNLVLAGTDYIGFIENQSESDIFFATDYWLGAGGSLYADLVCLPTPGGNDSCFAPADPSNPMTWAWCSNGAIILTNDVGSTGCQEFTVSEVPVSG